MEININSPCCLCAVIFPTHFPASIKPTLKTLEQCVKSD